MLLNSIEGPYLKDLLDQPAALNRTWENLPDEVPLHALASDLASGKYRRVVLTGMGSSYHALYPLHLSLTQHGYVSHLVETSELLYYMRDLLAPDSMLIAVSQSGQSAETIGLLDMLPPGCKLIAVTNNVQSKLAHAAQIVLLLHAGVESTVSCKTYVASLLMLEWLGAALTGQPAADVRDQLALASSSVEQYLESWCDHVPEICGVVRGVRQVFVTGRGASLAAAGTGGLILKESVRFSAEGMSSAAFRHGPFEMLNEGVFVMVMAGDYRAGALNRRLASDIREAGGRSAIVDSRETGTAFRIPAVPSGVRPIVEILPVQMLTLALASLIGREPGKFELATKVTTIE